jgi:hypothetical protein
MATQEPDFSGGPPMSRAQEFRLLFALERWVERLRFPDRPFFGYQGWGIYSARELVEGVAVYLRGGLDTEGPAAELGRRYLETINFALQDVPFEVFLASVERSGSPRSPVARYFLERADRLRLRLQLLRSRSRRQVDGRSEAPS